MNVGYEGFSNMQLLAFNGERVKSLKHLARLADESREEFLRFDLFRDRLVVLEAAGVAEATTQICEDNSIPSPRSADLVDTAAIAAATAGEARAPLPPLAGVRLGRPGEAKAEAEAEPEGGDLGQQQQQPTTGVNGGTPRQPSAAGAAVPARGKREPQQQQSGRGAAGEGRRAEPRRARWRSAAATALRRVGASAPTKGGRRLEEGPLRFGPWLRGAKRASRAGIPGGGERNRRMRRGPREAGG